MRKFHLVITVRNVVCLILLFSIFGFLFWRGGARQRKGVDISHLIQEIKRLREQELVVDPQLSGEVAEIVRKLNQRNAKVRSFMCDNIDMKMTNRITVNVTGEIYYEKERNLRLLIGSFSGREMDIGSNQDTSGFGQSECDLRLCTIRIMTIFATQDSRRLLILFGLRAHWDLTKYQKAVLMLVGGGRVGRYYVIRSTHKVGLLRKPMLLTLKIVDTRALHL
jgi:hypothetical protein